MQSDFRLIEPSPSWQAAFVALALEFAAAGDLRYQTAIRDFAGYLHHLRTMTEKEKTPIGLAAETTYWLVDGPTLIGSSRLRHELTPALEQVGGHIGYDIRPSRRRQGYGTHLLALTLDRARQMGMSRVLATCDTDNIGSARIIEKNGGHLLDRRWVETHKKQVSRYWIELYTE